MDAMIVVAITVAVAVASGLALGLVLRPSMTALLREICGKEASARFWMVFSQSVLILTPLFVVFLALPGPGTGAFLMVKIVTICVSGSLLLTITVMGKALSDSLSPTVNRNPHWGSAEPARDDQPATPA